MGGPGFILASCITDNEHVCTSETESKALWACLL